ncbi:MAG: restriction endonuclease subunit S [Armatimonadetes bacterium]|nr:restriction endonuclease subunit S [Armatimonadota bacterium]
MTQWPKTEIGSVCVGIWDGPHATPKPSADGPVYLGIGNITEDGALDLSEVRHIAEDDWPEWTKSVTPQPGDIVFTCEATLNRYAMIPDGFRGCLGRRTALIRVDPELADRRYVFYQFFGAEWRDVISNSTLSGSTVDRIPIARFPSFQIRMPPLQIQRKIASILSAYDDLIENNLRRIKILEEMAQSLYKEWFVDFRFPGHESVKMVDSPLGMIPEGWTVRALTDVVDLDPMTPADPEQSKPYVPMSGLSTNSLLVEPAETRTGKAGSRFRNGDTLFARITPCLENGKTGMVQFLPSAEAVALGSTEFIVMRPIRVSTEFVYLTARRDDLRDHAKASMSGASGRQRVDIRCFDEFLLAEPPLPVLRLFDDLVKPMFGLVRILANANNKLRQTRDLLLPKLISGEIDVSDLDIGIGEDAA